MASINHTAEGNTITYTLLVVFTVNPSSDEHLRDTQAIPHEAASW
jgi:hypothetical protein